MSLPIGPYCTHLGTFCDQDCEDKFHASRMAYFKYADEQFAEAKLLEANAKAVQLENVPVCMVALTPEQFAEAKLLEAKRLEAKLLEAKLLEAKRLEVKVKAIAP